RMTTRAPLGLGFLAGGVLARAAQVGMALVAVVGGVRLVDGRIAFEPALTVLVLAPELYLPLRNLAAHFHASADGAVVAERMLDLSEEAPVVAGGAPAPDPATEPVVFERVWFSYPLRDGDVLQDVDLELRPGEMVALVGPSGAGKSTLVALLLGFASPSAGRIRVGDVDLADVDPAAWRRRTAYVPQRPTLFRGTV